MKLNQHTQTIINGFIENSVPFILVEWRGMKPEIVNYVDKKTGKAAEFGFIGHTCESLGREVAPMLVRERPDPKKGEDCHKPESIVRPFNKGDHLLVLIQAVHMERGILKVEAKDILAIAGEDHKG